MVKKQDAYYQNIMKNMVIFVDIRKEGKINKFAFFDAERDCFCELAGKQAWASLEDFYDAFLIDGDKFINLMEDKNEV